MLVKRQGLINNHDLLFPSLQFCLTRSFADFLFYNSAAFVGWGTIAPRYKGIRYCAHY